jgi:hypothetical protein
MSPTCSKPKWLCEWKLICFYLLDNFVINFTLLSCTKCRYVMFNNEILHLFRVLSIPHSDYSNRWVNMKNTKVSLGVLHFYEYRVFLIHLLRTSNFFHKPESDRSYMVGVLSECKSLPLPSLCWIFCHWGRYSTLSPPHWGSLVLTITLGGYSHWWQILLELACPVELKSVQSNINAHKASIKQIKAHIRPCLVIWYIKQAYQISMKCWPSTMTIFIVLCIS